MLKVQLLSESCNKPLKVFKQETDAIRLCFRKKLNALENFLERGAGMEARRLASRSRVTYKRLMFRDRDSNCISCTRSFTRLISLHLSFLLPLHCLSFLPPTLNIVTKSEISTLLLIYYLTCLSQPSSRLKILSFFL